MSTPAGRRADSSTPPKTKTLYRILEALAAIATVAMGIVAVLTWWKPVESPRPDDGRRSDVRVVEQAEAQPEEVSATPHPRMPSASQERQPAARAPHVQQNVSGTKNNVVGEINGNPTFNIK